MPIKELIAAALVASGITAMAKEAVVIVPAHPDDMVSAIGFCLKARGQFDIHVVDFTHGERGLGPQGLLDGTTRTTRIAEEEKVCAEIGATLHWLDEIDGEAYASRETCHKLANLLKELQPRAVIGHYPVDIHGDHMMAGATMVKAVYLAAIRPEVYFFEEEYQTKRFVPDVYLDITDIVERKYEIIRMYRCQYRDGGIERRHRCADMYSGMHTAMMAFGHAEAFKSLYPRMQGERWIFDELAPTPSPLGDRKFQGDRNELPRAARPEEVRWPDRLKSRREAIEKSGGEFDLVFVGDSITHAWENAGSGLEVAQEGLKDYRILNLGYSGNRTEQVIWRLQNGELDGYKAKLFMVMIGTNNGDSPEDIALGVKTIIANIRAKHPEAKVLLLPIFPRGETAADRNRIRCEKVNAIIRDYADGDSVLWLDFNSQFLDAEGRTSKDLQYDRLHLTPAGFRIWLKNVLPVFEKVRRCEGEKVRC